jgi:hypothetical protein
MEKGISDQGPSESRLPPRRTRMSVGLLLALTLGGCDLFGDPGFCSVEADDAVVPQTDPLQGHTLALSTMSGLAIVDSAGRRHIPGSEGVVDFSWNRDGSGFFVTRDGVLGSLPLEGGAVAEIYSDWVQARFPALSPDGRTLAVSVNLTDDAATGWETWLLDVGGENPRHVAEGYDASWSPDGTKLYFERFYEAEPPVRLAVLDVATGETTPLLRESGRDFSVEVSPQRTYAAFSRGSARKLMLYTFADSALVALTRGAHGDRRFYDRFVSFSPDEDYIVFFRQVESSTHSTFQILGCDLTTGRTRIIEEGDVLRALFAPSRVPG